LFSRSCCASEWHGS